MDGIDRLHARGVRFMLKTVLMRANEHELDAMRAMAAEAEAAREARARVVAAEGEQKVGRNIKK